jgi:hypothetical protein
MLGWAGPFLGCLICTNLGVAKNLYEDRKVKEKMLSILHGYMYSTQMWKV